MQANLINVYMNSFTVTGLHDDLLHAIQEMGFETPTPIQAKTIPHLLSSQQDLIALAQTGTGKTAAFGLPALQLTEVENRSTQTLILCPTRELCLQITNDLTDYAKHMNGINVVPVYGGASIDTQIRALKKGAQIVVATPGRAKDLIQRKKLQPGLIKRLVLDEADEMLSMGFKDELEAILAETPKEKQNLLFSATMSDEILRISKKYMDNPLKITVTSKVKTAANVDHQYYQVRASDKYEVLKRLADINPDIYGLVFCRTRRETKDTAAKLMTDGYNADSLHGDLSQAQRDEVMGRFRKRSLQILVATDVAARGLDVDDLTHVINLNMPDDDEVYVHRSGRTGRAGKKGISIAIVHSRELHKIRAIEKKSGIQFTREQVPGGKEICKTQLYKLIDSIEHVKVDEKQIEPFLPAIYEKLEWLSREELIKHFVSAEFNRFLDYYKNAKDLNVNESSKKEKGKKGKSGSERKRGQQSLTRLYINAGSKDNLNPARLIGIVNEGLDSGNAEIGKIEILKKFSFFEIEEQAVQPLISSLKGKKFEGVPLMVEKSNPKPEGGKTGKRKPTSKERKRQNNSSFERKNKGKRKRIK